MPFTPTSIRATGLALLAPALLAGCDAPVPAAATLADSAGVRVVENRLPQWARSAGEGAWTVDTIPLLEGGEGGDELNLHGVVAAARLPGGRLLVADASDRLRLLDETGRPARELGGPGEGPGEYRMIAGAGVVGDTIWSYDFALRRITYHDLSGELLGVRPLRTERASLLPVGWLPGSGPVLAPSWATGDAARATRPGLRRDTVPYVRFRADGEEAGGYGRFPAREYVVGEEDGRRTMATPLLARAASHALRRDRLIHGDRERWEIRVVAPSGTLEGVIRRVDRGADISLAAGDRSRELEARLADHGGDDPAARRFLSELPGPATRPAYGRFLVDSEDHLWVAAHAPGAGESESWSVFDPAGRWLGDVVFPPRFRPLQILEREVVGVRRDALDVERLQVLRLDRR